MAMTELGHVISSTALMAEPNGAVDKTCPRTLLGLACIKAAGYDCLCGLVVTSQIETVKNDKGNATVVNLRLTLPQESNPQAVMNSIDLTGYRADYVASTQTIVAAFNLRRPQNHELRLFVSDTGL